MELLRPAFVGLLTAVLAAAVVSFVVMGAGKARRSRRLAGLAHAAGRRFFRDDPYDIPRRYAAFALVCCGHSPRANNVTDARVEGLAVRAFDFRTEIGHGARRQTRYFRVQAVEMPSAGGDLLMWHDDDAELAPLAARMADGRVGRWTYRGEATAAAAVAAACGEMDVEPLAVEVRGGRLLVAGRAGGWKAAAELRLEDLPALVEAVRAPGGGSSERPGGS